MMSMVVHLILDEKAMPNGNAVAKNIVVSIADARLISHLTSIM